MNVSFKKQNSVVNFYYIYYNS